MIIDWSNFTPWSALAGGSLIGLVAALLFLSLGRIAGISGILGSVLQGEMAEAGWRLAFLGGLLIAPAVWSVVTPGALSLSTPAVDAPGGWAILVVAGLLVGFGTRLANGCTSGHGVCGLARFSRRSLIAVLCFMGSGMATVFVSRHLIGA
ncbi:YeeE/YedE family protein [Dechloromonas sp. H13]|uniref:YeeE/YedE family protein n=1 Tax=Dechloromonas sp. H13 TaxID=2570193 RepID=UPI001292732E|nr:YeeE/YedE family protein [Dechloromonas sp. H13]